MCKISINISIYTTILMVGIFVRTFPSSKTDCSVKLNNHIIIVIILQYSLKFQL